MNHTYPFQEYERLLKENIELEKLSFSSEDSKEYIISKIEERSNKKREIANIANTIIREYIEPFEKDIDLLTEVDVKDLEDFSNMLYPDGGVVSSVGATDYGIFYRIEKILSLYYKKTGDINKYIYSINRRSLGHMLLINLHTYHIQESPFRGDAIKLVPLLDTDKLTDKARTKLLLALAREGVIPESKFPVEELQYVFDILKSHISNPPTNNEAGNILFFASIVLQLFREHNIWCHDHNVSFDIEKSRSLIYNVKSFFEEIVGKNPSLSNFADVISHFEMAYYFLGDITLDELLNKLDEIKDSLLKEENPFYQIQGLGMFNNHYLNMFYLFSDLPKSEIIRKSQERVREVLPKLMKVTRLVNDVSFNRYLVEFLNGASLTGSFNEFSDVILGCTVYADKALFIHTAMVKEMSCTIFDYMIDAMPEYFEGVAGYDVNYIKSHKDEMKKLLSDCCMFHDIGKFFMLDIVENSMRRLTDDEFDLIKNHPSDFDSIFQGKHNDERTSCIRDCALTHHLWYDGTNGYPKIKQTKNLPFSSILAIADSIDAATDFYGRSYNLGKNIEGLIKEFESQAGTKYSKEVVEVLKVSAVKDKLQYWITEGRKDIYYRIYAFNKL